MACDSTSRTSSFLLAVWPVPAVLGLEPWGGTAELGHEHGVNAGQPVVSAHLWLCLGLGAENGDAFGVGHCTMQGPKDSEVELMKKEV